jgi:adenylate cyclase
VIALAIGAGLLFLRSTRGMETLELRLVDVRTRAFVGDRPADPRIVLAVIEEPDHERVTKSNLGAGVFWPWPLVLHDYAMKALKEAGVRAVLVDIYHLERGKSREDLTLTETESTQGWVDVAVGEHADGKRLGDTYAALERVVLAFQLDDQPTGHEQPARVTVAEERLLPTIRYLPRAGRRGAHATLPLHQPARGAALLGFANVEESADGVFRRSVPCGTWDGRPVLSLALAGAFLATDGRREVRGSRIQVGQAVQALDEEGSFFLNFRGAASRAYRRVSPADLIQWGWTLEEQREAEKEKGAPAGPFRPADAEEARRFDALKDAIIVYGVNLKGADDIVTTPLAGTHPGPEVQATALDNLLHGDGRVRVPRATDRWILLGLCFLAGVVGALLKGKWWPHVPPFVLLMVLGIGAWRLFAAGTVIDLITPLAGLVLTWGATSVLRLATEGRRNRWLEGTFGRYVSPEVVEALKKDPRLLELGGRRRELSVLFSDVANFTRISESLPPEQTVRLLNVYLTGQSQEVMATGGVIDKFNGDGVMAFWGDPIESSDHALRTVTAALRCLAVLPEIAPLLKELELEDFRIRIGVNSGPALVGNMGSEARFDYTCMGDNVNLASRLEGANKVFGSRLLVGPVTYLLVKDHVVAKRLADLVVVGRSTPVRVYEILSLIGDASEDTRAHAAAFARAHASLRKGDVTAALENLAEAESRRPGDGPTAWLRGLAGRMRRGEAPQSWDGTWRLTEK